MSKEKEGLGEVRQIASKPKKVFRNDESAAGSHAELVSVSAQKE
jgi:hypothetical protein